MSRKISSFGSFLHDFPGYKKTFVLDKLRKSEFKCLDRTNQTYLDYTGGGLYSENLLQKHLNMLKKNVFGNPHSENPSSSLSTKFIKDAKSAVLAFFNADPHEYLVIFTPNATGALKLVAEAYPFTKGGRFLQTTDNHNSVNGIREFAESGGANVTDIESDPSDMQLDEIKLRIELKKANRKKPNIFAYPAQSNFTGVQHPLAWINLAQKLGWDVILDAAAFVPTNKLDLGIVTPDFVSISFYKMFGYPTGIGCLIARKRSLSKLRRPWFSGGTIWTASVRAKEHILASEDEAFEDGTVNYLGIPAVKIGLEYLNKIGIEHIHARIEALTGWILKNMLIMRHSNGNPLFAIYGPRNTKCRGGTIAFNFLDPKGKIVDERIVEKYAAKEKISLRTGCFCNPGSGEIIFGLKKENLNKVYSQKDPGSYDSYLKILGLESGGAIRISLGLASNFKDVEKFLEFAKKFQNKVFTEKNLRKRGHC